LFFVFFVLSFPILKKQTTQHSHINGGAVGLEKRVQQRVAKLYMYFLWYFGFKQKKSQ
jgi:hypothetical protein